ncbi:MAG: VOC family protein [Cyclobacteriaceae bacterium]|jgi:hypothetical protein|nr:VOC family protein [Cyclobacteriaceae bacterium]
MRLYSLFLLFFFQVSFEAKSIQIDSADQITLTKVDMIARDVFETAKWYVKHLSFKVKKAKSREYAILEKGDFTLHITTSKHTVTTSQVKLPINKERINGFYELGFQCSDLDSLLFQYEGRDIRTLKDLGYNMEYQTNTVVLADPDGNRVKLFQSKEKIPGYEFFKPNYISITTSDIETAVRWYKTNLGFNEISNNYAERAHISHCILKKGGFIVELQEVSGRTMEITELLSSHIELARITVLSLGSNSKKELTPLTDNDGNKLKY